VAQRATPVSPAPVASHGPARAQTPQPKPVAAHAPIITRWSAATASPANSDARKSGGLSLAAFDVTHAAQNAEVAEKVIRKLQAGFMPPPLAARPDAATYASLIGALETPHRCGRRREAEPGRP